MTSVEPRINEVRGKLVSGSSTSNEFTRRVFVNHGIKLSCERLRAKDNRFTT
ncbi:MAG: hypothetical protein ACTS5A_03245 [Candidatus Hodgkinia cicadicola]